MINVVQRKALLRKTIATKNPRAAANPHLVKTLIMLICDYQTCALGACTASFATLAEELNASDDALKRALRFLRKVPGYTEEPRPRGLAPARRIDLPVLLAALPEPSEEELKARRAERAGRKRSEKELAEKKRSRNREGGAEIHPPREQGGGCGDPPPGGAEIHPPGGAEIHPKKRTKERAEKPIAGSLARVQGLAQLARLLGDEDGPPERYTLTLANKTSLEALTATCVEVARWRAEGIHVDEETVRGMLRLGFEREAG